MSRRSLRFISSSFTLGAVLAFASFAHAAEPAASDATAASTVAPVAPVAPVASPSSADLARASALLEQAAENAHAARASTITVGLVSSAVLLPTGVVLLARGGDVPHIIGTGFTASAGGALFATFLSLHRSGAERLEAQFQERRAAHLPDAELIRRTEADWAALAQSSAENRKTAGTIETTLGGVFAVGGSVLLLAPQIGSLPRRAQYSLGAILTGTGIPFLSLGLHSLFLKSPVETSWDAYRAGTPSVARASHIELSFSPVAGGGALLGTIAF